MGTSDCVEVRIAHSGLAEEVVVLAEVVARTREPDQVHRDELRALVEQLEVRVLAVRPRRAPHDRAGLHLDGLAAHVHRLAAGLHVELLEVRGEQIQVPAVGHDRVRVRPEEGSVPGPEQPEPPQPFP